MWYPELVGNVIMQKWQEGYQEHLFRGTVLKDYGDVNFPSYEFEVKYISEENVVIMELYKDLENRDLVIL